MLKIITGGELSTTRYTWSDPQGVASPLLAPPPAARAQFSGPARTLVANRMGSVAARWDSARDPSAAASSQARGGRAARRAFGGRGELQIAAGRRCEREGAGGVI